LTEVVILQSFLAPLLAREINVVELIVPRFPAAFSAYGMLMSDITADFAQTDIRPLTPANKAAIEEGFKKLALSARDQLIEQGFTEDGVDIDYILDLRYLGQEHSLKIDVDSQLDIEKAIADFNTQHLERYGHVMTDTVEVVALRVRGTGHLTKPSMQKIPVATASIEKAIKNTRKAYDFAVHSLVPFTVYDRDLLASGHTFKGPAIVEEGTSNTVIHGDQTCLVNDYGHLIITTNRKKEAQV